VPDLQFFAMSDASPAKAAWWYHNEPGPPNTTNQQRRPNLCWHGFDRNAMRRVARLSSDGRLEVRRCERSGVSRIGCAFLDGLEAELGTTVQHYHYGGCSRCSLHRAEFRPVPGRGLLVDGYIARTRTVVEVLGDMWHGHPGLGEGSIAGERFYDRFVATEERFRLLALHGYEVLYIWTSEWDRAAPARGQLLRFDGRLQTRTDRSNLLVDGAWVPVCRAGVRSPLVWGDDPARPPLRRGEVLLTTSSSTPYSWDVDPETVAPGVVGRVLDRLVDAVADMPVARGAGPRDACCVEIGSIRVVRRPRVLRLAL